MEVTLNSSTGWICWHQRRDASQIWIPLSTSVLLPTGYDTADHGRVGGLLEPGHGRVLRIIRGRY